MKFQELLMDLLSILMIPLAAIMLTSVASLAIFIVSHFEKRVIIEATAPEGTLMRCVPVEGNHATKN